MRQGTAFNAGKALVPYYITRDNALDTDVIRTLIQLTLGVRLSFILPTSRCVATCPAFSRRATAHLTLPGTYGPHHVSREWLDAGCHQLSCRVGSNTSGPCTIGSIKARHDGFNRAVLEGFAAAGASIDSAEIFISPVDNKRADGSIFHPALSTRGTAIDATIWNDLTLPRISTSACVSHWILVAAETFKDKKYKSLCNDANYDFATLAANVRGGFGPTLERMWNAVWLDAIAKAHAAGLPTRPISSLERRHLERIAATMARALHFSIWTHTDGRGISAPLRPEPDTQPDPVHNNPLDWY